MLLISGQGEFETGLFIQFTGFQSKGHFGSFRLADHQFPVTLRWNGTLYMDQKVSFNLVKKRRIVCYCTLEQKMNFEGFTQNSCYGNQPQPFELVFYSTDANTC